jgi:hypothetical protein
MHPTDPSPYRTIASALAVARANRQPSPDGPRSRAALRDFLARNAPSSDAARDAHARVQAACDARFRDMHDDYSVSPNGPRFNGSTPNTDAMRGR